MKNEEFNLNIMSSTLKIIISCDILGLEESYQSICFGHAFSKACQYATTNEKVCKDFTYVSIKTTLRELHKCITWPKKLGKG